MSRPRKVWLPYTDRKGSRPFLVAPVALAVPGVINFFTGPSYCPAEEVAKSAASWHGIPITLRHPVEYRARLMKEIRIGYVWWPVFNGRALVGEAWLDMGATLYADGEYKADVLARLEAHQPIEVSIGVMNDKESETYVTNAADVDRGVEVGVTIPVIRNIRPHHLAVLPDQRGALGIRHGCGINVG